MSAIAWLQQLRCSYLPLDAKEKPPKHRAAHLISGLTNNSVLFVESYCTTFYRVRRAAAEVRFTAVHRLDRRCAHFERRGRKGGRAATHRPRSQ